MPKEDRISMKLAKVLHDKLANVSAKTGLSHGLMVDEAVEWWLEVKAPIEIQHAEKPRSRRRNSWQAVNFLEVPSCKSLEKPCPKKEVA